MLSMRETLGSIPSIKKKNRFLIFTPQSEGTLKLGESLKSLKDFRELPGSGKSQRWRQAHRGRDTYQ